MRWPVRNGLAIPASELGFEEVSHKRRLTTNHHTYWERAKYQDKRYKQVFRGLLPHLVTLPLEVHEQLHDRYSPPPIPRDSLMIDVIDEYLSLNGVIDVVYEKKTNQSYQIEAEQWQSIRGLHRTAA